ncbi:hypothetical protein V6N13_125628 [Hibiscus sabdariffa]|uniref:Uncharacterized protein n=1 Tax=Hibiscus sabdariffa TaxID=183260 RepID=A0ABR2U6D8_9ROSI
MALKHCLSFHWPLSEKDLCRNCKLLSAEHLTGIVKIRDQITDIDLKLILDLYKQMIVDTEPQTEDCVKKSTDIKDPMCSLSSERKINDGILRGSYIVGGSVLGSNFITYGGGETVYYGMTKEMYRSRQMKSLR